jgi:type I restriction enzyme S subunit
VTAPAYPEYKASGVDWLGEIPEQWEVAPLFTVLRETDRPNEGLIETNLLSLSYGRIVRKDIDSSEGLLPESFDTYQIVEPGEIVLRLTDLQNDQRSLRVGQVSERGIITSAYVNLRPVRGMIPSFAFYLLHAADIQKVFYNYGGGVRQSMRYEDLRRIAFLKPSLEEQCAIAAFLDRETAKLDTLIEKKRALIELLKEQRSALISRTVTRGLSPDAALAAGLNPNPPMKDSSIEWLGEIPAHWDSQPLGYLVTFRSGATPDKGTAEFWDGDIPWVSPKDMKLPLIGDAEDHVSTLALTASSLERIPPGRVLVVVRGMILAHSFPVALTTALVTINQDMKALACGARLAPAFLFWLLTGLARVVVAMTDESAHGTRRLETSALSKLTIVLPPMEEQEAITRHLQRETDQLDAVATKVEEAIERLREYRSALITSAVTGKIDVRDAAG